MALESLRIKGFRCLHDIELELDPQLNLITGPNASGKTSLLEAVFFLSRARSFRTPYLDQLIQDGESECLVNGKIRSVSRETTGLSLSDAEPAKNLTQQILDIDSARDAAQRIRGAAQIFSAQFDFPWHRRQKGVQGRKTRR